MRFLTNLTLGKKITLLTIAGLILGVGVFGVFSSLALRAVNQAVETMLQDRMTTARLVAIYLDEALGRALTELEDTAQRIDVGGEEENLESQTAALEQTYARLSISTYSTYLLNGEGEIIWSKPETPGVAGINISAYPNISQAIKKDEASISGLVSAPATQAPVVFLVSPTKEGGSGSKGVLVVAIDPAQSSIGGFVQPIRLGQTGYVEIVDEKGIVVARTEPGPKLAPFERSDHSERFAALISAAQPTRGVCHTCHEPEQQRVRRDVLAFFPLTKVHWGVVIRQSEEEALAPIRRLRWNLLFSGVGLGIVALTFVVVTTRDVGGRIRSLTLASQKIAGGDLTTPVIILGKDEMGILAETLDDMRIKLKQSYDDLAQKTRELAALLSVSEILTTVFDLPSLLKAILAKAVEIIPDADGGLLLLQGEPPGNLFVWCAGGLDEKSLASFSFAPGSDFSLVSVTESADQRQRDKVNEVVTNLLQSETLRPRVRSSISTGVSYRNQNIGGLIMVNFQDGQAFSESDHRLLQAIADHIAIAIERAQLAKEAGEVRALQEADRLRSQLISSVSHELRSPLTLIKGYSTSLLRRDVSWDEPTQREFLQTIDEKTDELRDLIDKLLQAAKLEAGALKLEKEPILIPQLVRKVVEDTDLKVKRHKLALAFAPSFPVVEADVRCMEQVLRNLVQNAVKYSPDGSEITIAGEVKDSEIIVSVADQGIGISPEHQDRIFERFYRVDNPLVRRTVGSGLGLAIVKGHVEAHGGRVWLESTVGKGSKFYFSLPLETDGDSQETLVKVTSDEKNHHSLS